MRSLVLVAVAPFLLSSTAIGQTTPPEKNADALGAQSTGSAILNRLPLQFVENREQWDTPARFVARKGAMTARLEDGAIVLELRQEATAESVQGLVLRLAFEGSSEEVRIEGEGLQRGKRNFFIGSDPKEWISAVPSYSQVLYRGLYDGVDLRVRDHQGRLEYDVLLAPGADLGQVVIRAEGAERVAVLDDGSLLMETERGPVRQSAPRTWYELPSGENEEVECLFVALGGQRYGFALPERKPDLPVVIDPGLEWSTFLGRSENDFFLTLAVEPSSGHVLVGGRTYSMDFPTTRGACDRTHNGGIEDGVIACLDPDAIGSDQLVWSTFLGGSERDRVMDLQVDDTGAIYLVGQTNSSDLPTTAGAYDTTKDSWADTFVARMSADGRALEYSTYLGGAANDLGVSLVLTGGNSVAVAGATGSVDFPISPGAYQPAIAGGRDVFVSVLELAGNGLGDLPYSTYLGGGGDDGPALNTVFPGFMLRVCLTVGTTGDLVVSGRTQSSNFPTTANAYDSDLDGPGDVFVTRLSPAGGGLGDLLYSSYLGGSAGDNMHGGLMVDLNDVILVGGETHSDDFPTTSGAYEESFYGPPGLVDAFVLWLDTKRSGDQQLLYSTLLTGGGNEGVLDLLPDGSGGVIVSGYSGSDDLTGQSFPITCGAWQPELGGGLDAFISHLTPAGNGKADLLHSTFLGGEEMDLGADLALVSSGGSPVVFGMAFTSSTDFPTTHGALSESFGGVCDGAIFQLDLTPGPWTYCSSSPNSAGAGAFIGSTGSLVVADNTFTLTVTGATPNQFGMFYYGKGRAEVPFGDGLRCVTSAGSGIYRLGPPTKADGTGALQRLLDFTKPPAGAGAGKIDPGTAWNFQFWYRDPNGPGGSGFNLSDALRVSFCL